MAEPETSGAASGASHTEPSSRLALPSPLVEIRTNSAAKPAKKSGTWVAFLALVLAAAAAGWLLRPAENQAAPTHKVKSVLHLDTFVLNLADPSERAYLRVGIDLGLSTNINQPAGGGESIALIRDTILGVLARAKPGEVLTSEGKNKLKEELLRALRERAPELGVEEVYFTEFLVQR